jgi:hypothetical protein
MTYRSTGVAWGPIRLWLWVCHDRDFDIAWVPAFTLGIFRCGSNCSNTPALVASFYVNSSVVPRCLDVFWYSPCCLIATAVQDWLLM